VGLLAAITVTAAAANVILLNTAVGQQALVDQWERTAIAFGQPVDDARYAELQAWSARGPAYGVVAAVLNIPGVVLAVTTLIVGVFGRTQAGRAQSGRTPSTRVPFATVLAVVAHTGIILALRLVVAAPIAYARETTASATSLSVWFPGLDDASPVARFFGLIDVFAIWWAVVLAIGVSLLYRRPAGRLAVWFIGLYAGVAAGLAIVMALLSSA
jgi:hypothetical protein